MKTNRTWAATVSTFAIAISIAGSVVALPANECPGYPASVASSSFDPAIEYPDTARKLAKKWARVFQIPSSWLVSQSYAESLNHPTATNKSGATGLLQIKLTRARDLVKWIEMSRWKASALVQNTLKRYWHGLRHNLLDPDLNVMLAAFDLHHLRQRFGSDHRLVAAAYNQGEGRISRCLAAGHSLPPRALEYVARVERAKRMGYV
jgi:soluble lytic murein transglycosylase-like protein